MQPTQGCLCCVLCHKFPRMLLHVPQLTSPLLCVDFVCVLTATDWHLIAYVSSVFLGPFTSGSFFPLKLCRGFLLVL